MARVEVETGWGAPENGAETGWDSVEDSRFDQANKSWAEEVEDAMQKGWIKGESPESWKAIAGLPDADDDELRPWRNKAMPSAASKKKKSKSKGDPKLREQRRITNSLAEMPPRPIPRTGVRKGWSSDEDDDERQTVLPLSYQMGWDDPEPMPSNSSPSTSRSSSAWDVTTSDTSSDDVPDDGWPSAATSLNASPAKGKRRADLSNTSPPAPLPARDPDHNADSKGPWRREDGTLQDRFGNDIVEEGADDWSTKPKEVAAWGSAVLPDRPEVGWGDADPMAVIEDSDDGQYEYVEIEEVKVPLRGLKVATEPAKTLDLLHLRHLELRQHDWDDITEDELEWLAESALPTNDATDKNEQPGVIGFVLDLGTEEHRGKPPAMCLSTVERALLVRFPEKPLAGKAAEMLATVLHSKRHVIAAFRMYEAVQLLHYHYNLHFSRAYDLGETYTKSGLDFVLDTSFGIAIEREIWHEEGHLLALEAWANCLVAHAAALNQAFIPDNPVIDTFELSLGELRAVATGAAVTATLASMEQREHKGYIESAKMLKGQYVLTQGRYSTRARRDDRVTLLLEESVEWVCKVWETKGREIVVRPIRANAPALDVESVLDTPCKVLIAPHEPPQEAARREFSRSFLLGHVHLEDSRVLRNLFLGAVEAENERPMPLASNIKIEPRLNEAQAEAIRKIYDNSAAVLIHGPPGTGKTTVIAHAAKAFLLSDPAPESTMMIVANSNAAIKQCAEALLKHRIASFRLVTSTEYYVGWHAHHYSTQLQRKLVRSDEIKPTTPQDELNAIFKGVRIVLCTLSTLATRKLDNFLFERRVPLLVADEASQIVWSTFLPAIWKIRLGLRKAVFVGDELQLPPFGATQNAELVRSVFEIEPRPSALEEVLLDTCYRMPVPLGDFISDLVYKGTLLSKHDLLTWSCTRFITVEHGCEARTGTSWSNPREAEACTTLVRRYYSGSNFCIITPYDAQRDMIERYLKEAGLQADGRVQSIDAAQGSEFDYVILSLVRTSRHMGFLAENRRMNVMLTRQKKGLCIITHPRFLDNVAAGSLVGQLAHYAARRVAWSESIYVPYRDVLANIASLPMGNA